ncbi:MAG: hypothetical protein GF355_11120 [Candidatus Eisenbacteria bacterium]|nr:hypothetical protein [Candidatus Eisenbacteria bacterium]
MTPEEASTKPRSSPSPRQPSLPATGGPDILRSPAFIIIVTSLAALVFFTALFLLYSRYGQAPHRLIKIVAAVAVMAVLLVRPRWTLALVLLAMPYAEWLPKSGAPFINSLNMLVAAMLLSAMISSLATRKPLIAPSSLRTPVLLFLAWTVLSWLHAWIAPLSEFPALARARELHNSLFGLYIFFLVHRLLAAMPADMARRWIRATAVLLAASAALGTLGAMWQASGLRHGARVGGGLGDINKMGTYYAMALIWTLAAARVLGRDLWARLMTAGLILFNTLGLVFPNSRGAFVAFLAGGVGLSFSRGMKALAIGLVVLASIPLWIPEYVAERVDDTLGAFGEEDRYSAINETAGGRLEFWEAALEVIIHHPLVGVGFGVMPEAIAAQLGVYKSSHNFYLEVAAEMGLPALILILLIFYRTMRRSYRLSRSQAPPWVRATGEGTVWVAVTLFVANIFGSRFLNFSLSGYFFVAAALVERATAPDLWPLNGPFRDRADEEEAEEEEPPQNV